MLPSYDQILEDDTVVEVGRLRLRTIHTPGHTPGSMCFLVEGAPVLFSGDTLFPGGAGQHHVPRWRLPHHHRRGRAPSCSRFRPRRGCCPATATPPRSAPSAPTSRSGSTGAGDGRAPLRYDERPYDDTPIHTADLPPTPVRDRNIPASAWVEAPDELLAAGRRPARHAGRRLQAAHRPVAAVAGRPRRRGPRPRYWVARADDLTVTYTFRLYPDGDGVRRRPERRHAHPLPRLEGRPPRRGVTAGPTGLCRSAG